MKKIKIIDLLLTFLLLSMLVGSFVYVSKINLNDKSNEIEIEAEENFGSGNDREADFTWNYTSKPHLTPYGKGENEEIQSLIDEASPFINLCYKYTEMSEEVPIYFNGLYFKTKYLNVDFRFLIGLTKSVYESFSSYDHAIVGIEVIAKGHPYRLSKLINVDDDIKFINVAVGDMINTSNALTNFTFKPFVVYDNDIYYSSNFKSFSVVNMVETYYLNEVEAVESLYEIYVNKGYIKEETL